MGRFTVIANDAFDALQVNAGVLLTKFDPADPYKTPKSEDILATTTGGVNPTCKPTYSDYGEDVDNVPINMMEFKRLDSWDAGLGFTSIKFNAANTKWALGAADSELLDNGVTVVRPRRDVKLTDFSDLWWVGDKANGGAYAIKLLNALSTDGLNIQSTKNGKGTNAIKVTGHVSIDAQDVMPMEIYDIPPQDTSVMVTVKPERGTVSMFGTLVSDMQTDVKVTEDAITGTLKYLDEGSLVDTWGAGYFLGLKFSDINEDATSVKVGLDPSQSSGLVEIIDDPDKNGAFKITDKNNQIFKVVTEVGDKTNTQVFSLAGLELEPHT